MTPAKISYRIVADRLKWIDSMLAEIQSLPLNSFNDFIQDSRNIWSAESCLRRSLEALLDLGRHIIAKGFGQGVSEYKEIAQRLQEKGILGAEEAMIMKKMAGYRNRLVHFYQEVSTEELYEICIKNLNQVKQVGQAIKKWVKANPELTDSSL